MAASDNQLPFAPSQLSCPGPIVGLSSVNDAVACRRNATAVSTLLPSLEALRTVCEAANTLPCVKYLAQLGITVLEIVEEIQITNEAVRGVALRAKDIVLVVANACSNASESISGQLERELQQLTHTMNDILSFTRMISSRSIYRRLRHRGDDASAVKSLDLHLTHAFHLFEIQSNVSLRIAQQQLLALQLSGMPPPPQAASIPAVQSCPPLVTGITLYITEGLYIIRNAADGRVIETEHRRPAPEFCHACMSPSSDGLSPYQIWVISSWTEKYRKPEYVIRNFATGAALDVCGGRTEEGTNVICYPSHLGPNQTWSIYGSKAEGSLDYCTIRSHGPQTIMDGQCPAGPHCDYVHMTSLREAQNPRPSQQWSLTRIPFPLNPSLSAVAQAVPAAAGIQLPRRLFVLQNMVSGHFAAVRPGNGTRPNVYMQSDFKSATSWHFEHTVHDDGQDNDMFAIVAGTPNELSTLDFYYDHIVLRPGVYRPNLPHHMWKAVPAPRERGFCFRHCGTGRFLSQPLKEPLTEIMNLSASDDASCQWRILDASTGDVCPILYDSSLTIPPEEYAGPLSFATQSEEISAMLVLRTGMATATMYRLFVDGLKREHATIRNMLNSGYSSLVLSPRLITGRNPLFGFRREKIGPTLGPAPTFQGKKDRGLCLPPQQL